MTSAGPLHFTVTVDGPAAAGKGTISRAVADRFGFSYLDTGLLYRATGARVSEGQDPLTAAQSLTAEDMQRTDLRTAEAGQAASKVAALPDVRAALITFQRDFARREGGAILDGRDIGTVICPDAEVKLFVTAADTVRAQRRFLELSKKDATITQEQVLADVRARDARDSSRDTAPMRPATDALLLDTSDMSISTAVERAVTAIDEALKQGRG